MEIGSLDWYLAAGGTMDLLGQQELLRPPMLDNQFIVNWLYHAREHGRDAEWIRDRIRESPEWQQVNNPPPLPPLPAIHTEGKQFVTDTGAPWVWKGATDFLLYKMWLEGKDILPILKQRREAGANLVRVLGMCHNIVQFYPQLYSQFYVELFPFVRFLERAHLYVEFVVFADQQHVQVNQQDHFRAVCDILRGYPTVFMELVNEWPQNGIDPRDFTRPAGMICSRGSSLSDAPPWGTPTSPWFAGWAYHTWHGRRDWPKVTSSFEDAWGVSIIDDKPIVHDEPMGFAEVAIPGRRSIDPRLARMLGAGSVTLGAGGTFHSEAGLRSELWGPIQQQCAKEFYEAQR